MCNSETSSAFPIFFPVDNHESTFPASQQFPGLVANLPFMIQLTALAARDKSLHHDFRVCGDRPLVLHAKFRRDGVFGMKAARFAHRFIEQQGNNSPVQKTGPALIFFSQAKAPHNALERIVLLEGQLHSARVRPAATKAWVIGFWIELHISPWNSNQFASHHGYGLAGKEDAILFTARAHISSTRGGLVSDQIVSPQTFFPERRQAAVSRARDRVFVNTSRRRKETRNIIVVRTEGSTCEYQPTRFQAPNFREFRAQGSHGLFTFCFNQIIKAAASNDSSLDPQCQLHILGIESGVWACGGGRKIQFDPDPRLLSRQHAGFSVKSRKLVRLQASLFPKDVGTR